LHSSPPHIAIIILNWNGLEDTKECLDSVFKNDYPNYSIYIVDNASKVDELSNIKKYCEPHAKGQRSIVFVQNSANLGFAEGNNVAIRKAMENGTDYIFTLNNDTVVDPKFLSEAVKVLGEKKGIVATKMIHYYDRPKLDNIGHDLLTTGDTVPRGRNWLSLRGGEDDVAISSQLMGACAGAALFSSKMLKDIGLFDKDFFLNYEDADLSLRAIVRGYSIVYSPSSIVYHKINQSIKKIKNTEYRIRSQRNQLWAYLHNAPWAVILLNLPWIVLRDLLVILVSIITFRWTITKIFVCSRIQVLKSLPKILKKRRVVQKHRKISALDFWFRQTSFLTTYWKYFLQIVIQRKNSVME